MSATIALVMAGGRGSRMAASGPGPPKPLVPVGGVPLLERAIRSAASAGAREVFVALGARGDEIETFLSASLADLEVPLTVLHESRPLGTIGALGRLAARDDAATILVVNGDVLFATDLGALLAVHHERRADLTVATHEESLRLELGEVVADADDRVVAYREKPLQRWRISSGLYAVEPSVAALLDGAAPCAFPELVERALAAGRVVLAHADDAPWIDVNDAGDLCRAEALFDAHRARFERPLRRVRGAAGP